MSKTMTARKWSDPVRHERIIARIVECLLEAKLDEAREAWRSRAGMARAMSRQMRIIRRAANPDADRDLLAFFNSLAVNPVTMKSVMSQGMAAHLWPRSCTQLERAWLCAVSALRFNAKPDTAKAYSARLFDLLDASLRSVSCKAFVKLSANAAMYDHLTQLPDVAKTPRPRKPKRTLVQTRADKAAEAAKLWRRRLRLAKAKLEKYTKQMKYYAKKEVKE